MSNSTQENPTVDDLATETVSKTTKRSTRTRGSTDANSKTSSTTKTTRPRAASTTRKSTSKQTPQSAVQQDQTMTQNTVRRVAIIGGNRIPFARSNGAYFTASNSDMLTAALNGLVERHNLQGQRLGEVVAGAVLKHSRDFNMTREIGRAHV